MSQKSQMSQMSQYTILDFRLVQKFKFSIGLKFSNSKET